MDGTFVKEIATQMQHPMMIAGWPEEGGVEKLVVPNGWNVYKAPIPKITSIAVDTLDAVKDYVEANVDAITLAETMLHVLNPTNVLLIGKIEGPETDYRRHMHLRAEAFPLAMKLGAFMEADEFLIGLMTHFVETPERNALIALVGGIKQGDVRQFVDNGIAQEVTVARGVTLVKNEKVPNPVVLAPWRTFREVEQPASPFVVRMQSNEDGEAPFIGLFEADGGEWKLRAVAEVAQWLRTAMPSMHVIA